MKNADMPAMPFVIPELHQGWENGLTKREAFAKSALVSPDNPCNSHDHEGRAKWVQEEVDALLAQLERTGGES